MTASSTVSVVPTTPYSDQKPGTSGLRKKVKVFQQPHYTQNFIQATLNVVKSSANNKDISLVVGGDGRYYLKEAIQIIIRLAAGNGISKLIIGQNGILSTPAASNLIRQRSATGGILCTASHNPGGPENDFGVKYNVANGGPAPEGVTNKIFENTKSLKEYVMANVPEVDLSKLGTTTFSVVNSDNSTHTIAIEVVDSVKDYISLLSTIFDFPTLKSFLQSSGIRVLFDAMHGVTGPYISDLFLNQFQLPPTSVMNATPSETFGNGHPDPNLTYAHDLVERVQRDKIDLGFASDGDGDRNMVISHDWFVNPSDSVALIAAYAHTIPYFQRTGLKGLARSMPTSCALDRVAASKNVTCYEVPTGWKFFGNLMDAGKLSICGEESFGTGSDHIREKDGIWAVLCWLSIASSAYFSSSPRQLVSIKDILHSHYRTFGRNFFSRYDYEEVDSTGANAMMDVLRTKISEFQSSQNGNLFPTSHPELILTSCDDFSYTDPIDGSVSKNQGLRFLFNNGSIRMIFRLSGTGSSGATVRMYVEKFVEAMEQSVWEMETGEALKGVIEAALEMADLKRLLGRENPTVIT